MKRTLLIILLFCGIAAAVSALGEREPSRYESAWTLHEFAQANRVPPRKLSAMLGKDFDEHGSATLAELGVSESDAAEVLGKYYGGELGFVGNIAEIGMLIVFVSLIRHLHIFERTGEGRAADKRSVRSIVGTISSSGDLSDYALAAVIAAIFLHEEEVEQENKLLLTWKRASTNMWKASRSMPNDSYFNAQGGWK
jgi:hypothetical protein